uniref:Uncharacterized protein n=1 Tax=Anopheles atroparvus TaxID=41427 RepID=A0AAG5D2J2_ANOAO
MLKFCGSSGGNLNPRGKGGRVTRDRDFMTLTQINQNGYRVLTTTCARRHSKGRCLSLRDLRKYFPRTATQQ